MLKKVLEKTFYFFTLLCVLFSSAVPAYAFSIPSVNSVLSQVESRYHINKESVQSFSEGFNVSEQKTNAPEVMISFTPSDPKPGEEVTAHARPFYFKNDTSQLYFTWYIKHDGDGESRSDVEKWKREAAYILANDGYNTALADYTSDDDNDGYRATLGGDALEDYVDYCAIQDFESGGLYEFSGGDNVGYEPSGDSFDCPSGTTAKCVADGDLVCPTTVSGSPSFLTYKICTDESDTPQCLSGESTCSNPLASVRCVPDTQTLPGDVSEIECSAASSSLGCSTVAGTAPASCEEEETTAPSSGGVVPKVDPNTHKVIPPFPLVAGTRFRIQNTIYNISESSCGRAACCLVTEENFKANPGSPWYRQTALGPLYQAALNGWPVYLLASASEREPGEPLCGYATGGSTGTKHTVRVNNGTGSGIGGCNHLFPSAPDVLGDGSFDASEEEFWGTNPHDPDTAGTGRSDEANALGLGRADFTWIYQVGDKVGVAVEGLSFESTKHDDRSNYIMWALPRNKCPIAKEDKSFYYETVRGYRVEFPTADINLNDCLPDNLVDPREGRQAADLDVSLSYLPDTPFNDATGAGFGDTLYVRANVGNASMRDEFLHFNWRVEASTDGTYNPRDFDINNPNAGWVDITGYLVDNDLISHTEGNGLTSLQINLNILEDRYLPAEGGNLKITAEVTENIGGVGTDVDSAGNAIRQDRGQVIVEVTSTEQRITPYTVSVGEDSRVTLNTDAGTICEEEGSVEKALCFVTKGEIIGVRFDGEDVQDYTWKLNDSPLTCDSSISPECSDTQATNVNFFPITGDTGDTYTVTMSGTDVETGKTLEIERSFQVVDPFIKIVSEDQDVVWPVYMGTLTNDNGEAFENYSDVAFETYPGSTVDMYAEFHPGFVSEDANLQWYLDGTPLILEGDVNRITFTADSKNVGDFYTIEATGLYRQSSEMRNAIKELWGVAMLDIPDKYLQKSVTVRLVTPEEELVLTTPKGLFAAAISNASRQMLYVVQLLGSMAVIVFLMGLGFSLSRQEE